MLNQDQFDLFKLTAERVIFDGMATFQDRSNAMIILLLIELIERKTNATS